MKELTITKEDIELLREMKNNCLKASVYDDEKRLLKANAITKFLVEHEEKQELKKQLEEWEQYLINAKEMFAELDFYLINENPIIYRKDDGGYITEYLFNPVLHSLQITEYEEYNNNKPQGGTLMYLAYLKAINKQIEELGWLDAEN